MARAKHRVNGDLCADCGAVGKYIYFIHYTY